MLFSVNHRHLAICGLALAFAVPTYAQSNTPGRITGNEFNPAISFIIDARYTEIDDDELEIAGFQLGGEAELPEQGFTTGHNEFAISANVDDKFFGLANTAIIFEDGETEIELEEAFVETLTLPAGFTIKAGRFYSNIGYLNTIHDHYHDFADRPLVYDAILGGHLADTGIQTRWVAPTPIYLMLGAELLAGSGFPGGESSENNQGLSAFAKTGGDIGDSSSWQFGLSYYQSDFDVREAGAHAHGGEEEEADNELLDGEVEVTGIDFVYKWAPQGNSRDRHFKLQAEYFFKKEEGLAELIEGENSAEALLDGEQQGFYVQAVYQFVPMWRVGLRYDYLNADNDLSDFESNGIDAEEFLEESSLVTIDNPQRYSIMFDYSPSHFSRIRMQYSRFDNGFDEETNDIFMLQYLMSLGSHGTHAF